MRFRDFHRNIKIRIIETFTSRFVGGMIFPFMTIYLAQHFGVKTTGVLLLITVFIGIANSFLGGYLSDQFGRKKVIVRAEAARFIAFMMMMVCNSPFFQSATITFAMMVVNSISWGMAGPANDAMLIDVSTPEQRKLMYSITYWANNLSTAVGGILGALLFQHFLFELFIALCVVELFVLMLVIFFITESHIQQSAVFSPAQHLRQLFSSYSLVFRDRLFVLFVIAGILVFSMEQQLTNYIGIRLSHEMPAQSLLFWKVNGLSMLGFLRSENTFLVVLFVFIAAKVNRLFRDRAVLIFSCTLFSVGYGVISYTNNVWLLVMFMVLLTIGEVFRVPVEQSYAAAVPPAESRSAYMAINGLKYNLALLIASLTITISAYLPKLATSFVITGIGLSGTALYAMIIPAVDRRIARTRDLSESMG